LSGLEPPVTAGKPWWAELFLGKDQPPPPPRQRPVWTAQIRDSHRSLFGPAGRAADFYPLTTFYGRLGEELEQAQRQGQPLAVVVVQLPDVAQSERRLQRELEIALRLSVRCDDLPVAGGRVVTGMACFPTDGNTPLALLRVATWRSLTALPGSPREPDPELTRLLGPLNPAGAPMGK
jgi:hypothetical protein